MGHAAGCSATTRVLAWGLIAITVSGCSSWQATRVTAPAPGARPTKWGELNIIRKSAGEEVTLHAWSLEGDTLRGTSKRTVNYAPVILRTEAIALNDVALKRGNLEGDSLRRVLESTPVLPSEIRVRFTDGSTVQLRHARVDGDSLRGLVTPAHADHQPSRPVAFALKDVWAIETRQFNTPKTLGLVLVGFGVAYGLLLLVAISESTT